MRLEERASSSNFSDKLNSPSIVIDFLKAKLSLFDQKHRKKSSKIS